ncbi:MAG TPA: radical SAM protein [Candidatus Coatesbacteria bacterium]|nr:radical SAM protein [Candidatus Coatesbacteria bacterium]
MLTAIHILLTYTCNWECDHCFLFSSPRFEGTFSLARLRETLDEARKIPSLERVCFEGGEPTLYYPLLVEGVRLARERGFKTEVVTNAYWAGCAEDAALWLAPLVAQGLDELTVSDDPFHREGDITPGAVALAAARSLGLPASSICIERPVARRSGLKGEPVLEGGSMLRGRAVEKLTDGLPLRPAAELSSCPHEELEHPGRVHLDPFGHVHLCQGLSLGNFLETPLSELVQSYDAARHPVCGPLVRGGPHALANEYGVNVGEGFADECHYCYLVRKALRGRFPDLLAPPQVYGQEPNEKE